MEVSAPKRPPEWLFAITCIPYGVAAGFALVTMPFLLRKAGITVEDIGWFTTATFLPSVVLFLYAPVVDLGARRRTWLIVVSVLSALFLWAAMTMPLPSRSGAFLALMVAGQWLIALVSSCNGALMSTTLPDEARGRAGGFYNAGNLGGSAIGAFVTMTVAEHASPFVTGAVLAALIIIPSLAALAIHEAPRPRRQARDVFVPLLREVAATARSRPGWTGILFCISPVGTAALMNQFSALGVDYHASDRMVTFVNGPVSGLVTAVGSLFGGYLSDRIDRRNAYLLSGFLTALCALAMMAAPLSPMTYAVGVSVYLFISGICYAAFSAVVLESIGVASESAGTQFSLFTAAGNFAIMYTGLVDTRFHASGGPAGLLRVDALLNLLGVALLFIMLRLLPPPRVRVVAAG